jgi:hypothetical protein
MIQVGVIVFNRQPTAALDISERWANFQSSVTYLTISSVKLPHPSRMCVVPSHLPRFPYPRLSIGYQP